MYIVVDKNSGLRIKRRTSSHWRPQDLFTSKENETQLFASEKGAMDSIITVTNKVDFFLHFMPDNWLDSKSEAQASKIILDNADWKICQATLAYVYPEE